MANRLSQEAIEAILAGDSKGRLSQEAIEALLAGDSDALVSQEAIEVLHTRTTTTTIGLSHLVVEVLTTASPLKAILGLPRGYIKTIESLALAQVKSIDGLQI